MANRKSHAEIKLPKNVLYGQVLAEHVAEEVHDLINDITVLAKISAKAGEHSEREDS